jgi:hypothetical protein
MAKQRAGTSPSWYWGKNRAARRNVNLLSFGDLVGAKVFFLKYKGLEE